jgi:glycosyltransferase involved in cell wall biosynthesis
LRVALDGIPLLTPKTGIGKYTQELAAGLNALPSGPQVAVIYGIHWLRRLRHAVRFDGSGRGGLPAVATPAEADRIQWLPDGLKSAAKRAIVRGELALRRPDLIHATNYVSDHLTGNRFRGPTVLTIHDCSFIRYPETHPKERLAWLDSHLPSSLDAAAAVIADSEFTRRELIELMGVAPDRVHAVALGVDRIFHPQSANRIRSVLGRHRLAPNGYLLSVGTIEPRKNIATLIAAYNQLPTGLQERWPLALVGQLGWKSGPLATILEQLARKGRLRQLGYVPDHALPAIYAGAGVFVYPSLYEGFGLPPLEAMACGVPVVASDRASLPEVVGQAGLLVDPEDCGELTAALKRLMTDADLRRGLGQQGRQRAMGFSWEACARKTLSVYQTVLSGSDNTGGRGSR